MSLTHPCSSRYANTFISRPIYFFALFSLLFIVACEESNIEQPFEEDGTINIGISWPSQDGLFIEGAKLAVKEANAAGGVLGQNIELVINTGEEVIVEQLRKSSSMSIGENIKEYSRQIARDFINNSEQIVAIVGHSYSFIAFSAANIYQQKDKVFIAPTATNMLLTSMDYNYVFRMLPNNQSLAQQLADYSHKMGYKKIAIFNERSEYALELSIAIAQFSSQRHDIKTVIHDSFFSNMSERDITAYAIQFRKLHEQDPVDAIFIISGSKIALNIFSEFRRRGIDHVPFIGGEGLDNSTFWAAIQTWQTINEKLANFSIPTIFHGESANNQGFVNQFKHVVGKTPDRLAAIGYDAINVLIRAIRLAGSSDPSKIADEMHYMNQCDGVSGAIKYQENGDLSHRKYMMKERVLAHFDYRDLDGELITDTLLDRTLTRCITYDRDADGIINKLDNCPDSTPAALSKGIYLDGKKRGCPIDADDDGVPDYRDLMPNNELDDLTRGVDAQGRPIDTDQDQVPDYRDISPNDPKTTLIKGVNKEGLPTDTDDDKVPDYLDKCPNDSTFELSKGIDDDGCPLDSDNDLVPNYDDQCPNDSLSAQAQGMDDNGCPIDSDKDNIPNYRDHCPNDTRYHKHSGVNLIGCPIDRDQDGVPDYADECPDNTTLEISMAVNAKGCPFDRDKDQHPDYRDECPANSPKDISRGVNSKGCPVDSDKDNIIDVHDLCPDSNDKAKAYGQDDLGCPLDLDQDGVADYIDQCINSMAGLKTDAFGCLLQEIQILALDLSFTSETGDLTSESEDIFMEMISSLLIDLELIQNIEVIIHQDTRINTNDSPQQLEQFKQPIETITQKFIEHFSTNLINIRLADKNEALLLTDPPDEFHFIELVIDSFVNQ